MAFSSPRFRLVAFALTIILSIAIGVTAWLAGWVQPETIRNVAQGGGATAMVAYVLVVILAEWLWMPRMWGLFAGGALFGPLLGGALSLLADSLAALLCFAFARSAGRSWVESWLDKKPAAKKVMNLLTQRRGATTIAVLRICPVAHFTLVSYAAGLAGIPLRAFLIGNTLGILPGAILYPLVGDSITQPTSPVFIVSTLLLVGFLIATFIAGKKLFPKQQDRATQ
jgi:uncharacterized membrane protein YdjX (TVP38/TMEM64 family)